MAFNLKNRHFLTLRDFSPQEISFLLQLSADLKTAKYAGTEVPQLNGKEIALIFEKNSTRTRVGFEVAAYDQGARVTYLGPTGNHIGHKESVKDTARVLGRVYDAIEYRGFGQKIVEELAEYAGVPVYNMGDSLLIGGAKMGMDVRLCAPKVCWPDPSIQDEAQAIARETGARITITEDIDAAVAGVDFVYTDVWVSMGEPKEKWGERIKLLMPYQVNTALMEKTGCAGSHTRGLMLARIADKGYTLC